MAAKKYYLEGDGNGGYKVSKTIALPALISITIVILCAFAGMVMAWQNVNNEVITLNKWISDNQPKHDAQATELENRIIANEISLAVTQNQISTISEDIKEIKQGIREINAELKRRN